MSEHKEFIDAWNLPKDKLVCELHHEYLLTMTQEEFNEYYNRKCVVCPMNIDPETRTEEDLIIGLGNISLNMIKSLKEEHPNDPELLDLEKKIKESLVQLNKDNNESK